MQRRVRRAHRGQVVVRDQRPLAGVVEVGGEPRAQLRVGRLGGEVPAADPGERLAQQPRAPGRGEQLGADVDDVELHPAQQRVRRQRATGALADGPLGLGQDPGRGALQDVQLGDARLQLGDELDRRRTRPDDRDARAGEVGVVVPAGRVEHRAGELGEALDVGQLRVRDQPGRADQHVRGELPGRRRDPPAGVRGVPAGGEHVGIEADVVEQAGRASQAPCVVLHLVAGRVEVAPVRVGHGTQLVQRRRRVDADPRVGVVAPHPADVVGPLQQDEVVHTPPQQGQAHGESGEPRTHDGDPRMTGRRAARHVGGAGGSGIDRPLDRQRLGRHGLDGKGFMVHRHARAARLTRSPDTPVARVTPDPSVTVAPAPVGCGRTTLPACPPS